MLRRRFALLLAAILAVGGITAGVYAQLETADRGILPLDSSGTLEITGIRVDVGGENAQAARFAGWRMAQRLGFRALWAKMHHASFNQAPNLPDGALDQIVTACEGSCRRAGPVVHGAHLAARLVLAVLATWPCDSSY